MISSPTRQQLVIAPLLVLFLASGAMAAFQGKDPFGHYTEEHEYSFRPRPDREHHFGHIGVTGIKARIYLGVEVKIEDVEPDTPAAGKFKKGQIITGVNGIALRGRNPLTVIGRELNKAETIGGNITFEVKDNADAPVQKVAVTVPVLGKYSTTWPLNCAKSKKIVKDAAEYYANDKEFYDKYLRKRDIHGALACLFLLSTGEDKYLPIVKAYFERFPKEVQHIGDNTWNNGYNGVLCAEYYLRTGDKSVLPILQFYCDDAKARQSFGCSWNHWGYGLSPGYVGGGLMNPAGAQVLTTLLLGKESGVNVDDATLMNALTFWYRFAGHGTVPYGNHRGEGGLGSNGKDGMAAAMMHIASGTGGDTTIYKLARDRFAMSMVDSYPVMIVGHGDNGRGDAIWRGIASAHMMEKKPGDYRDMLDRLQWWYALCRRPSGAFGVCGLDGFDEEGSGAAVALTYTAPLKTLRITGAPHSKYSKSFTLPKHLWGTDADRAFLSIDHNPRYLKGGEPEPIYVPFFLLGNAYNKPEIDLKELPREYLVRNAYHSRYMIRAQAAKALLKTGAFEELEKLLEDPDPRVRRAGLDGLMDYNYWFTIGQNPIKPEQFSPRMIAAVKKMLSNPEEALWVLDGALMVLKQAPATEIDKLLPLITPWTKHEEWWLRESAFMALAGMQKDDALLEKVLPVLNRMMIHEYDTQPRERMVAQLQDIMRGRKQKATGKAILAAFLRAIPESKVKPDVGRHKRSAEGAYNVAKAAELCLREAPDTALDVAKKIAARFKDMGTRDLWKLIGSPGSDRENTPFGLYTLLDKLSEEDSNKLKQVLLDAYLPEIKRRMATEGEKDELLNTAIDIAKLRNPDAGWKPVGTPAPQERMWRFMSFDPLTEKDRKHPREKQRFRDVALPEGMENWYKPEFDDSKWKSGRSPIGKGVHEHNKVRFDNRSEWGDGEFLLARTSFNLDKLDCDIYRVTILCKQGFHIYLNGHKIQTYVWWKDMPHYRNLDFDKNLLQKGRNTLAFYGNVEYLKGDANNPAGQMDFYIVGLKKDELGD